MVTCTCNRRRGRRKGGEYLGILWSLQRADTLSHVSFAFEGRVWPDFIRKFWSRVEALSSYPLCLVHITRPGLILTTKTRLLSSP